MLRETIERRLHFSPEQLFDLVADVERYPEFLRWWIAARIGERHANVYYTDQALGLGPIRIRFTSKTVLHRPRSIDVTSDDSVFRHFKLIWLFNSEPDDGCRVGLTVELELRSRLLQAMAEHVLSNTPSDIVEAFEARARRLYGRLSGQGTHSLSI